jgi:hypothetical protein
MGIVQAPFRQRGTAYSDARRSSITFDFRHHLLRVSESRLRFQCTIEALRNSVNGGGRLGVSRTASLHGSTANTQAILKHSVLWSSFCGQTDTATLNHDFGMEDGAIGRSSKLLRSLILHMPGAGNGKQSPSCEPRQSAISQPRPWYETPRKRESRGGSRA